MNWPWNRDPEPEPEEDELEYAEEEAIEEPLSDPLAELPEAQRRRVEELVAEATAERVTAIRRNLAAGGLDLSADDQPRIADPNRAAGWLGFAPAPAPAPTAPAAAPAEPVEEMPDPYGDPAGFRGWVERQVDRRAEARLSEQLAPLQKETKELREETRLRSVQFVLPQVADVIQRQLGYLPREMLADPAFEEELTRALLTTPESQWRDPHALAVLAGAAAASYAASRAAEPDKAAPVRGAGGRFVSANEPRQQRSALNRAALTTAAPSRDAGRQSKGKEVSELHRRLAELNGISPEEAAAYAADTTGDAAAQMRAKRLERLKGGGR